MRYEIIIEPEAERDLYNIFKYISNSDSVTKAKTFIKKLQKAIDSLSFMPQRCRDSFYIDNNKTKDLIFNGYTICYYIGEKSVHVVAIFRQR